MCSAVLAISILLVTVAPPQKQEDVIGTILAYDHFNNLLRLTFVESRVTFIVRTEGDRKSQTRLIQVAYTYWDPEKDFPSVLIEKEQRWRFKLVRDRTCDHPIQEFTASEPEEKDSKLSDLRVPIWKLLVGAEEEKIPFGEVLPCYKLERDDFKPYRK